MPVFSEKQLILVADKSVARLLSKHLKHNIIAPRSNLCLFEIEEKLIRQILNWMPKHSIRRYMDKYYLLIPNSEPQKAQALVDGFFDMISLEYESLIDVQRNLENITNLLAYLRRFMKKFNGSSVMDYGCGTGLSLSRSSQYDISIVGVDASISMRQIATSRGMYVLSPKELTDSGRSFDAAFASYVFHLLFDMNELCVIWKHLKIGGVIVANFHKSTGVTQISQFITSMGGAFLNLASGDGLERHGPYFAYFKKR